MASKQTTQLNYFSKILLSEKLYTFFSKEIENKNFRCCGIDQKVHKSINCLVGKNAKIILKIGNYFRYKVVMSKLKLGFS